MQQTSQVSVLVCLLAALFVVGLTACQENNPPEGQSVAVAAEPAEAGKETPPPAVAEKAVPSPKEQQKAVALKIPPAKAAPEKAEPQSPPAKAEPAVAAKSEPERPATVAAQGNPEPAEPLSVEEMQQGWEKFLQDAITHYAFSDAQKATARQIMDGCVARTASRQQAFEAACQQAEQAGDAGQKQEVISEFNLRLEKMSDQVIGRITALASLAQAQGAKKQGFEPPPLLHAPKVAEVGRDAPDWVLKTPEGKSVSLKSLRGKVVLLKFWASWCGYCRKAAPVMQTLHDKYKDQPVAIYAVNCRQRGKGSKPALDFIKDGKYTYNVLLEGDQVADSYQVQGLPTLFVVGRDGKVTFKQRGFGKDAEQRITEALNAALKG
jgi:thiol-disulfide isomerase/thioredoxin